MDATHVKAFRQTDFIGFLRIQMKFHSNSLDIHCNGYSQIFFEKLLPNQRFGVEIVSLNTISTNYNHYDNNSGSSSGGNFKEEKCSTSDPESGWFHKGEHKQVFAYSIETACDKHGWILGYTVNRGNLHNSRTFKGLYDKIKNSEIETIIADAGYKT